MTVTATLRSGEEDGDVHYTLVLPDLPGGKDGEPGKFSLPPGGINNHDNDYRDFHHSERPSSFFPYNPRPNEGHEGSDKSDSDHPFVSPQKSLPGTEGEVYMTLLSPQSPPPSANRGIDFQFEAILLLAYRVLHKPSTKDLHNRQFVVLTTKSVLPEQMQMLRAAGAIIQPVTSIGPPTIVTNETGCGLSENQFTKLQMWTMTQYTKILYLEPDVLVIRPLSKVFETPLSNDGYGSEYVFAALNDAYQVHDLHDLPPALSTTAPIKRNDTFRGDMFLIRPSIQHSLYVSSIYRDTRKAKYFPDMTALSLLQYAYRKSGPYPWTNLLDVYIPQQPKLEDLERIHAIRHSLWSEDGPVDKDLRRLWYFAWWEMRRYDAMDEVRD